MNIYEDEKLETKLEEITDQMGHLVLDIVLMSLQKINSEDQIFKEFLEYKLDQEDHF